MTNATIANLPVSAGRSVDEPGRGRRDRFAAICILAITAVGAILAIVSDGVYMDDDVTHYLIARTAWSRPALLLDEWGRPGFTIPYAAVAWLGSVHAGFVACRLLSVALMGATAWLTYRAARHLEVPYPAAAPVLLLASPLYFHLSFTTTTETIAAFYAIAVTLLLLRGQRWAAAAVLAMLPVTRHELIVLLVPVGLYFLWRRDWVAAMLLAWAEVAWNALVWAMDLQGPSGQLPIGRYFATADAGILGDGAPWHFVVRWMAVAGIVGAALAVLGAGSMIAEARQGGGWRDALQRMLSHRQGRVTLLIIGGAFGLVALHTWLYMVNTHLSGGYARFLIPAAPWTAICAAWGVSALAKPAAGRRWHVRRVFAAILTIAGAIALGLGEISLVSGIAIACFTVAALAAAIWPWRRAMATCTAIAVIMWTGHWLALAQPHRLNQDQLLIRQTLAELRHTYPDHFITGSSPWIQYFLDHPVNLPRWYDPLPWEPVNHPVQTLYVYDQTHGKSYVLEEMAKLPHRLIGHRSHAKTEHYLSIYERLP